MTNHIHPEGQPGIRRPTREEKRLECKRLRNDTIAGIALASWIATTSFFGWALGNGYHQEAQDRAREVTDQYKDCLEYVQGSGIHAFSPREIPPEYHGDCASVDELNATMTDVEKELLLVNRIGELGKQARAPMDRREGAIYAAAGGAVGAGVAGAGYAAAKALSTPPRRRIR